MHKLRSLFKKRERASKSTSPNPSGSHIGLTNLPPKPNGQSLPPPNKLAAIPLSTDTAAEGGRCEVSCYSYSIKNINMENSTKLLLNSIKDKLVLEIELSSKLRRLLQVTLLSAGNEGNQSDDVLLDQLERLLKERFDLSTTLIKEMEELILVIDQSLQVETDDKKTKSEHCKYDRSSQSSTSEMSILQEHIRNMEETHCSTNEELQATIQELSDLQAQLDETRNERERYKEEKKMLLDSLCRQSERLYSAKTENINLQKLLHETADDINLPEREKKLIELLKKGQVERESLQKEKGELLVQMTESQRENETAKKENLQLLERIKVLEHIVEETQYERKEIDDELRKFKEKAAFGQSEIYRLTHLLQIEFSRVAELQATEPSTGHDNKMFSMLENALKDKDLVEKKLASVEERLAKSTNEIIKLKEKVANLELDLQESQKNAGSTRSALEQNIVLRKEEKIKADEEIQSLKYKVKELDELYEKTENDLTHALEKIRKMDVMLEDSILKLKDTEQKYVQEKELRQSETASWNELQGDLLVAVRVANEFKTDCQIQLGITEDYVKDLEQQICLLKSQIETGKEPTQDKRPTDDKKPSAKELGLHLSRELPVKKTYSRPSTQCVSVKSLIESIEKNASKQTKPAWIESQSGSTLTSPQRETAPAPLRDLQVTSNKQKISDSIVEPDKEKSFKRKI
ncbi:cytospin-A isoform X2 [Homalodisca vitripennis]|uniref:cytospin-A isoform X2 n=1 Tax=Homalodisca vitripennis TaxID=197043 RepID=UPI001EE9FF3B|nr:cytospin-A isoform X2 [Homalodisca vitripennis]